MPVVTVERVAALGSISQDNMHNLVANANGVTIDDDTMPLEENIPTMNEPTPGGVFSNTWRHNGICF